MTTSGRKYTMTKLGPGDWLLPSNDAKWLWRIFQYEENGSLTEEIDGKDHVVVGMFWACARRPMPREGVLLADLLHSEDWEFWAGPYAKRQHAIEEALRER